MKWNEVTWYSRALAIFVFFVVVPIISFYLGVQYESVNQENKNNILVNDSLNNSGATTPIEQNPQEKIQMLRHIGISVSDIQNTLKLRDPSGIDITETSCSEEGPIMSPDGDVVQKGGGVESCTINAPLLKLNKTYSFSVIGRPGPESPLRISIVKIYETNFGTNGINSTTTEEIINDTISSGEIKSYTVLAE